jgi:glutamine amidotransferase
LITIVDYGVGNVGSIANMLSRAGFPSRISGDPGEIACAAKIILPGVGSFDYGMAQLRAKSLVEPLQEGAHGRRIPVLGICLGCQLMAKASEEGTEEGLGWLDAKVVRFRLPAKDGRTLPLPHMGWNEVQPGRDGLGRLFAGLSESPRFYFVHSYHLVCDNSADEAAQASYGYSFTAAVQRENLYGVQFHPEKSHRFGLELLGAFARLP